MEGLRHPAAVQGLAVLVDQLGAAVVTLRRLIDGERTTPGGDPSGCYAALCDLEVILREAVAAGRER